MSKKSKKPKVKYTTPTEPPNTPPLSEEKRQRAIAVLKEKLAEDNTQWAVAILENLPESDVVPVANAVGITVSRKESETYKNLMARLSPTVFQWTATGRVVSRLLKQIQDFWQHYRELAWRLREHDAAVSKGLPLTGTAELPEGFSSRETLESEVRRLKCVIWELAVDGKTGVEQKAESIP